MKSSTRRTFLKNGLMGLAGAGFLKAAFTCRGRAFAQPNFIIVFVDDMGYGDTAQTGHPALSTPNLERLARRGTTLTQFYSAASVCTPSRAALLTGRYPIRTGMVGVVRPDSDAGIGLPHSETTLAAALKEAEYSTSIIGKWHLGHEDQFMPARYGFDEFFGLLYSNDMSPVKLYRDGKVVEYPVDQNTLTRRYTEEALSFIRHNRERPFFLYLAHTMPHTPLGVSERFRGRSKRGLYGDAVEELDWSLGQILDLLDLLQLRENTFIAFTSDNGPMSAGLVEKVYGKALSFDGTIDPDRPWNIEPHHGGSAGLLRGGKATTFEGGFRVPCIISYPKRVPHDRLCSEVATTMDLFTTCLTLAGLEPPADRPIDGIDIIPCIRGERSMPERVFCYYRNEQLCAIRAGKYKLHFTKCTPDWRWVVCDPPELYDLEHDPSEKYDIGLKRPDLVDALSKMAADFQARVERAGENRELLERFN